MAENYDGNVKLMAVLVYIALLTILLSIPNLFFGHEYMCITRHFRLILQVFAAGTTALALSLYFVHRKTNGFTKIKIEKS
jgi:hypothetical protein